MQALHGGNISSVDAGPIITVMTTTSKVRVLMSSNNHILIVDDAPNITSLLKRLLSREGYRVTVVATADEMRQCVKQKIPDLIHS